MHGQRLQGAGRRGYAQTEQRLSRCTRRGGVYRFKAIAVYYFDPSEQGAGAFDLYGSTDLSSYYDYLTFVAGIQARSLFDTGVDVGDDSRFLTVTTHSDESGVLLCITGRLIREGRGRAF